MRTLWLSAQERSKLERVRTPNVHRVSQDDAQEHHEVRDQGSRALALKDRANEQAEANLSNAPEQKQGNRDRSTGESQ